MTYRSFYQLFLLCAVILYCQPLFSQLDKNGRQRYTINDITFTIDGATTEESLRELMLTMESPAAFWTWVYQRVYEKLGSKPVYYDQEIFSSDIMHIETFLRENGYIHSQVDTSVQYDTLRKKVEIEIGVNEGRRSMIDTLKILGLDDAPVEVSALLANGALVKVGDPYIKTLVEQERVRLLRVLLNNGYTMAGVDSVAAIRYLSTDNFTITYAFHLGKRYVFGFKEIEIEKGEVTEDIIERQIDFQEGQIYNEEKKIESEQNLSRLGIFEKVRIESQTPIDTLVPPKIPLKILLSVRDLQEVTPEFLVDNENESLNSGLGLGYSNRNFLGDARNFSARLRFRLQSIDNLDFIQAVNKGFGESTLLTKMDGQTQLIQPYFFSNKLSASVTISAEYEKQRYYILNTLRSRLGLTNKFASYTLGFVDWYLERVSVSIDDTLRVKTSSFTGTREKQFNSILTFTLQRDKTNDVFSPTEGFFHSASVEEAGVIPRVFGNLGSGLPFAEYYKLSIFGRHYFSAGFQPGVVWAFKLRGGFAELYNSTNQTPVPPTRKFYGGGSGSVRGWKSRSLAAFENPAEGGNVIIEGSVESRIRLFPKPEKFWIINLESLWGVLFADYGNIWNKLNQVQRSDIAIAAGFGLRYETFVGPLRFDAGFRIYDPNERDGRRWIFQRKLLTETFSILHFGIGHAF